MDYRITHNEHGTPMMARICRTCGEEFTVTPAPQNSEGWENCLSPECESYDPDRDADALLFGETQKVVSLKVARARRKGVVLRKVPK